VKKKLVLILGMELWKMAKDIKSMRRSS
jgi:hypothetical protein